MEITQQVRDYAAKLAEEERQKGMEEMSAKFRAMGSELYVEPAQRPEIRLGVSARRGASPPAQDT